MIKCRDDVKALPYTRSGNNQYIHGRFHNGHYSHISTNVALIEMGLPPREYY